MWVHTKKFQVTIRHHWREYWRSSPSGTYESENFLTIAIPPFFDTKTIPFAVGDQVSSCNAQAGALVKSTECCTYSRIKLPWTRKLTAMWTVLAQDQGPLSSFSSARSTTREPVHSVHVAKEASSCCTSCVCIELVWLVQLWLLDYAGSGVQWTGDLVNSAIPDQVWHAILLSIFPRLSQFSLFIFSWSNVCMVCCRNVVTSHRLGVCGY